MLSLPKHGEGELSRYVVEFAVENSMPNLITLTSALSTAPAQDDSERR